MANSGTYTFSLENADLLIEAWEQIGKAPDEMDGIKARSARRSLNLLFSEWANKGVNLWTVALVSIPIIPGVASYTLPANTIAILDGYISTVNANDISLAPISRSEYAATPNKLLESRPTTWYLERTTTPSVYVWPTGDIADTYTAKFYVWRQQQDAGTAQNTADVPYRWWWAAVTGLAAKLATKYAPDRKQDADADAQRAWAFAAAEDRQRVTLRLVPGASYR